MVTTKSYLPILWLVFFLLVAASRACHAFLLPSFRRTSSTTSSVTFASSSATSKTAAIATTTCLSSTPSDEEKADPEGADLAAQLFKAAQAKGVSLSADDLADDEDDEDEEDDDEDEEDEEEPNIPQGAINAFLGYDTGDVGEKLAGNVSLTDDQLYSEMKDRVLDTAGGFVELVGGASDEDDDSEDESGPKPYTPPTTVPDSALTAGEVVLLVLEALNNNNNPTKNKGVEILFGYSSAGSQIKNEEGLTPSEYADFLKETEYKVLFDHQEVMIDKGSYSFDGKKGFFTARLRIGPGPKDFTSCNFILSSEGVGEDSCWLVESMLIRPESMRRRRRK